MTVGGEDAGPRIGGPRGIVLGRGGLALAGHQRDACRSTPGTTLPSGSTHAVVVRDHAVAIDRALGRRRAGLVATAAARVVARRTEQTALHRGRRDRRRRDGHAESREHGAAEALTPAS